MSASQISVCLCGDLVRMDDVAEAGGGVPLPARDGREDAYVHAADATQGNGEIPGGWRLREGHSA
jgi:hypothetical protein